MPSPQSPGSSPDPWHSTYAEVGEPWSLPCTMFFVIVTSLIGTPVVRARGRAGRDHRRGVGADGEDALTGRAAHGEALDRHVGRRDHDAVVLAGGVDERVLALQRQWLCDRHVLGVGARAHDDGAVRRGGGDGRLDRRVRGLRAGRARVGRRAGRRDEQRVAVMPAMVVAGVAVLEPGVPVMGRRGDRGRRERSAHQRNGRRCERSDRTEPEHSDHWSSSSKTTPVTRQRGPGHRQRRRTLPACARPLLPRWRRTNPSTDRRCDVRHNDVQVPCELRP